VNKMRTYEDYKKRARIRRIRAFMRREGLDIIQSFLFGLLIGMILLIYLTQ